MSYDNDNVQPMHDNDLFISIFIGNSTLLQYDTKTWEPLIKLYDERYCFVDGNKFITEQSARRTQAFNVL